MRHRFHSICPYFAMFPETFAEKWISQLSRPGDVVLDPFAGRGTAPFQALLMERHAVAADINPVAACLNRAKLASPTHKTVKSRIRELEKGFDVRVWRIKARRSPEFFQCAYHINVLAALVYLRSALDWQRRASDAFVAALVLGALHGDLKSSRYLSNQMPRTISTKPQYSIRFWQERNLEAPERPVFSVLLEAAEFRFASPRPPQRGITHFGDMRDLPRKWKGPQASIIVTSPPYGAVTSYEEDQWLRLWFLGGPDHPRKGRITRDDQLETPDAYWSFIGDFWRMASLVLKPRGSVVVRIGSSKVSADLLARQIVGSFALCPREIKLAHTEISEIRNRQTEAFRPGSKGCAIEVDVHGVMT